MNFGDVFKKINRISFKKRKNSYFVQDPKRDWLYIVTTFFFLIILVFVGHFFIYINFTKEPVVSVPTGSSMIVEAQGKLEKAMLVLEKREKLFEEAKIGPAPKDPSL